MKNIKGSNGVMACEYRAGAAPDLRILQISTNQVKRKNAAEQKDQTPGLPRLIQRDFHYNPGKDKDMKQRLPIRWLAPEVLNTGTFTKKSDVYYFGVLLWEIYMDGQSPYADMSAVEVTASVLAGYRLSDPDKMPRGVRVIMTKQCFPGNPDERSRMSEIRPALEDVLQQLS
ncbi:unnamed protein product [Heligmosomoides polygyrus]|uniref:Protein kinase domain-containing protein n=1 Tax=Heligmosomoides polygyrus TaxID=6339 RepID=A0A183G0I2_HELPZ|nr:unnamed protein product [Heligmosomoides polygyrus]